MVSASSAMNGGQMSTSIAPEQAWVLLSFGSDRSYQGNLGYDDELESQYLYDSFVQNHKQLAEGDLVLIKTPEVVAGFARIQRIDSGPSTKPTDTCPECGTPDIKLRKNRWLKYRCARAHEFENPIRIERDCTAYIARFGGTFVHALSTIDDAVLGPMYIGRPTQQSIRRMNVQAARALVSYDSPQAFGVLAADAAKHSIAESRGARRGNQQGFVGNPTARRAVELHAVVSATKMLTDQGWTVKDVSARQSFDLWCRRGAEELRVEVKGTVTTGEKIILTAGEVRSAGQHPQHSGLAILSGVNLRWDEEGQPIASGGELRFTTPWNPDPSRLEPISYYYSV